MRAAETYRQKQLKKGQEYEDWLQKQLATRGIFLGNITSQKYQQEDGENLLGMEIKFDGLVAETGRVYVETAEKAMPRPGSYAPSGIYRNDSTWLYAVGNYDILFIFGKRTLRRLCEKNPDWLYHPPKDKATSQGFCIPEKQAMEIAEKVIRF
jgi:hypothetical protein